MSDQSPSETCLVCSGEEELDTIEFALLNTLCCTEHAEAGLVTAAELSLRAVIPERHHPARHIPPALQSWDGSTGAFLYGSVGTGKSWSASALMKRSWIRQYRITGYAPAMIWMNVATVFADIRSSMQQKSSQRHDPLQPARSCWLLALDDLGSERPSAWTAEHLYVLLNERYERMLPTIVTSNYDLGQLVNRMTPTDDEGSARGEQIVSRLAGMTIQVPFEGEDRRVPEA